ncbi:MAG: UPF0149 family protein [Gammaproteobacteria bacterium]|jgi:yecA family protein
METMVEYDQLEDALRRCGASWDASQAHGLLVGRLATAGADAGFEWLSQVLEGTEANNALTIECEGLLRTLFEATYRQLAERQSEFEPLLPDDEDATSMRAAALAHWCEGFLHGLVSTNHGDALKERLAAEPLADIIRDMLEITRAAVGDDNDGESEEVAYIELVEYLRVAAQLTYEELAEFRAPAEGDLEAGDAPEVLH